MQCKIWAALQTRCAITLDSRPRLGAFGLLVALDGGPVTELAMTAKAGRHPALAPRCEESASEVPVVICISKNHKCLPIKGVISLVNRDRREAPSVCPSFRASMSQTGPGEECMACPHSASGYTSAAKCLPVRRSIISGSVRLCPTVKG